MTCCAPGVEAAADMASEDAGADDDLLRAASRNLGDGKFQLELAVPDVHCATCITGIEGALGTLGMVDNARVNLSTKRVRITYHSEDGTHPAQLLDTLKRAGHRAFLLDNAFDDRSDETMRQLLRALAVSGFAAGNIMLFSVSIWSGADEVTRTLFHWISALIAIPAVGYAGRPFFTSAIGALRTRHLNMDVPIALAVTLALILSVFETAIGGQDAYFDASVSLLFFLLIGRTLDHMMRERARGAVKNLSRLSPRNAVRHMPDGTRQVIPISEIAPGMLIVVAAGERLPVDGLVVSGNSELDCSLVTGESAPELARHGTEFLAGTLNLSGAITIEATHPADESFLARMISLMEAAEGARAGYRRIADRAADIYAPAVHILALVTLIGWIVLSGDWHVSVLNAMAVLIITCPCALALAVPMVHMVASGRLFENGIMVKDSAALERLAAVTHVVFDKTGTLTEGRPRVQRQIFGDPELASRAAALAQLSAHPFSRALVSAFAAESLTVSETREVPGSGLEAVIDGEVWRLGRADWCHADKNNVSGSSQVWLSRGDKAVAAFALADQPRGDAATTIAELGHLGVGVTLLSGDQRGAVDELAARLGISAAESNLKPQDKMDGIRALQAAGHKVLMVGDGINDAPALRLADVSLAPSSAADVGRSAADFVFVRDNLSAVTFAISMARRADRAVKQNFGLAVLYNAVAVPLAVAGFVTPLIAALAMSSSSILVTLNALRLRLGRNTPAGAVEHARVHEPHYVPEPAE
ncbi:MAG: cadmium-translocating P-type ATPase [Hyphomicrobiaceae bacterium]|nr:cadmium-translocating P-type ATPase [Hyphomicrobiaceae bacterium]